jgi:hypothetical protein
MLDIRCMCPSAVRFDSPQLMIPEILLLVLPESVPANHDSILDILADTLDGSPEPVAVLMRIPYDENKPCVTLLYNGFAREKAIFERVGSVGGLASLEAYRASSSQDDDAAKSWIPFPVR